MSSTDEVPPIPTPTPEQAAPAVPPVEALPVPPVAPAAPAAASAAPMFAAPAEGYAPAPAYGAAPPIPPAYSPAAPTYAPAPPTYGVPAEPVTPNAYGQPAAYEFPAKRGLSLAAMICGIAGAFLSLFAAGLLPSIAAVILGHIASKRQPYAKSQWVTGLVTGYIGIGLSLLWGIISVIIIIAGVSSRNSYNY